jgi:hypothetical protein
VNTNGWIPKKCMLIILETLIKRCNFESKQMLGKEEITI